MLMLLVVGCSFDKLTDHGRARRTLTLTHFRAFGLFAFYHRSMDAKILCIYLHFVSRGI